jgi:ribonuclease HI
VDACFYVLTSQQKDHREPTKQREHWRCPPDGVVKVNCDGGFRADEMMGSAGAVVRNSDGSFIGASARWMPSVSSVLVAEAEACKEGLRLALQSIGTSRVIMETDSLQMVSLWKTRRQQ